MTVYYCIAEWDENYEVDKDNRTWKPGRPFRQGPLEYVRVKARGRDWSRSSMALSDIAGEKMYAAVGVFQKLAEIVAKSVRPLREGGIIRDRKGEPATVEAIAWMLRMQAQTLRELFSYLAHPEVGWLEQVDSEQGQETSGVYQLPKEQWDRIVRQADAEAEPQESAKSAEICEEPRESAKPAETCQEPPESARPAEIGYKTRQVKPTQRQNRTMACVSEAKSLGQLATHLLPKPDTSRFPPEKHDSSRLEFLYEIRTTLGVQDHDGVRSLSNLEQWLYENVASGRDGPDLWARVQAMAKQCTYGKKPVAVFLARVGRELGYVPPSRRPEQARVLAPHDVAEREIR